MRLRYWIIDQEFDTDRFALRRHALAVLDDVSSLLHQRTRLAQQSAILARSVGNRRHERLSEHLVSDLATERFEQGDFLYSWPADCHHVGILENGMSSLIGPVHDCRICPFEIECIDEGLAQTLVLEFLPSGVEEPALRRGRCMVGNDV